MQAISSGHETEVHLYFYFKKLYSKPWVDQNEEISNAESLLVMKHN